MPGGHVGSIAIEDTAGMRLVIRGGQVLVGDPGDGRFERGDVVVEDGRIAEIGPSPESRPR